MIYSIYTFGSERAKSARPRILPDDPQCSSRGVARPCFHNNSTVPFIKSAGPSVLPPGKISLSIHAKLRMRERNISFADLMNSKSVYAPIAPTRNGTWRVVTAYRSEPCYPEMRDRSRVHILSNWDKSKRTRTNPAPCKDLAIIRYDVKLEDPDTSIQTKRRKRLYKLKNRDRMML